jgi:D-beta-D-heptose 7-phosphate kinase/D-beta-D-heptose 1-phosphate adenosyltransferase
MKHLPTRKALLDQIDAFPDARVMVIGDVMIDHFIWGGVNRISPEAPVPVVNVTSESLCLGGAANVVHNIRTLGGKVYAVGVAGDDSLGRKIVQDLKALNLSTDGIIIANGRPTTVKTRIIAHSQQVVRFDREEASPLHPDTEEKLTKYIQRMVSKVDAILISDYGKGLISGELMEKLLSLTKAENKPVIVDPKVKNIHLYRGVTIITPNQTEASEAIGVKILTDTDSSRAAELLRERIECDSVLITRGEHGMTLLEKNGACTHIPTLATEVYDVTGAGDTVVSVLALALTTGAALKVAALLANYAAGIVIRKVGTATVDREELKKAIKKQNFIVNH